MLPLYWASLSVAFAGLGAAVLGAASIDERALILGSRSPESSSKAYLALFARVGQDGLTALKYDKNTGISLQTAWEDVLRGLKERDRTLGAERTSRFLGFVEGRLLVPPPRWWGRALSQAIVYSRDNVYYPQTQPICVEPNVFGLRTSGDTQVSRGMGLATMTWRGKTASIPTPTMDQMIHGSKEKNMSNQMIVAIGAKRAYIAVNSSNSGCEYYVYCTDSLDGHVVWTSLIWGANHTSFGPGIHNVELVLTDDDKLILFGAESHCLYIEGMNSVTGDHLFRFSSNKWTDK